MMILFPIIFLFGLFASVISFTKKKRLTVIFTGLVCLFNSLLLIGFYAFLAISIFPQGINLVSSYSIPSWQRLLPLLGTISLVLTIISLITFFKNQKDIKKWQLVIGFFAIAFTVWLYYWNLLDFYL